MKTVIPCTFRYPLTIVLGCLLSLAAATQELPGTAAFKRLDKNGDGWLDLAIGCDNIKNRLGGFPHSRLYINELGTFTGWLAQP